MNFLVSKILILVELYVFSSRILTDKLVLELVLNFIPKLMTTTVIEFFP